MAAMCAGAMGKAGAAMYAAPRASRNCLARVALLGSALARAAPCAGALVLAAAATHAAGRAALSIVARVQLPDLKDARGPACPGTGICVVEEYVRSRGASNFRLLLNQDLLRARVWSDMFNQSWNTFGFLSPDIAISVVFSLSLLPIIQRKQPWWCRVRRSPETVLYQNQEAQLHVHCALAHVRRRSRPPTHPTQQPHPPHPRPHRPPRPAPSRPHSPAPPRLDHPTPPCHPLQTFTRGTSAAPVAPATAAPKSIAPAAPESSTPTPTTPEESAEAAAVPPAIVARLSYGKGNDCQKGESKNTSKLKAQRTQ